MKELAKSTALYLLPGDASDREIEDFVNQIEEGQKIMDESKPELTAGQKAARTRKRRAAGKKAATTRKRRAAGKKAAKTRKLRAAGKKAAQTRKRRAAGRKAAATRKARKEAAEKV